MKILIVGGGIAGVASAYLLEKEHEVTLIEKGDTWRTIGFGVGVWKNGLDILKKFPLPPEFWGNGYPVLKGATIAKDGTKLIEASFATTGSNIESIALTFEREYLLNSLVKLLNKTSVRFNTTVKNIRNSFECAEVEFSNGEKVTYDLVIGADGIRSSVRQMIFGDKLVRYGWNIWGLWVSQEDAPFPGYYVFGGKNETLLGFPLFDKHVVGMMYKSDEVGSPPLDQESILRKFPSLSHKMTHMVKAIENPSQIFSDTLGYVEMKEWYKGRVVIIGDARHGMSPLTGMGTSLALEDAFVLAEEIRKGASDIKTTLTSFAKRRNKRLKSIQTFRRIIEFVGLVPNNFREKIRNILTPLLPSWYPIWILNRIFKAKI